MLLGAAVAISFQSVLAPLATQDGQSLVWGRIGIFVLSWMVFALIFVLVPHRRVSFRHAFVGAFLSSVLFELAKIGFVAYVTNANYAAIYGALATLPIFLFWLYLVWVVVLLGASLAASLTTLDDYRRGQGGWPANRDFQLVFRLVGHLRQAQRDGLKLSQPELLAKEPMASERQLQDLLRGLEKVNIATRDEQGDWLLSRDTDDLSLADLYQSGNYHLPMISRESIPVDSAWDSEFEKVLQHVHAEGMAPMGRSLRKLYQLDDKDQ
jgi:membrane protein